MSGFPAGFATGTGGVGGEVEGHSAANAAKRRKGRRWWLLLMALPWVGLLWPPFYARTEPVLWGFPFFYWYQFLWVPLSAVLTGVVYLATRRRR